MTLTNDHIYSAKHDIDAPPQLGLGIDTGGTQTRWALARADEDIIASGTAEGLTALHFDTVEGKIPFNTSFLPSPRRWVHTALYARSELALLVLVIILNISRARWQPFLKYQNIMFALVMMSKLPISIRSGQAQVISFMLAPVLLASTLTNKDNFIAPVAEAIYWTMEVADSGLPVKPCVTSGA